MEAEPMKGVVQKHKPSMVRDRFDIAIYMSVR